MKSRYKYCIVPECPSTSYKTPDKLFISLPKDEKAREAWQIAMRRMNFVSSKGSKFCCEDHFNVPEDIENYTYVKMMKSVHIKMKPGVIPHKFNCQQDRSVTQSPLESQSLEMTHTSEKGEKIKVIAYDFPFKNTEIQVDLKYKTQNIGVKCNLSTRTAKKRKLADTSSVSRKNVRGSNGDFIQDDLKVSVSGSGTTSFDTSMPSSSNGCLEQQNCKEQIQKSAIDVIEKNPKLYLGIPSQSLFLPEMLSDNVKLTKIEIFLTLKKIRMNVPYSTLADEFCMSTRDVCLIIHKTIPKLAAFLKSFIQWKSLAEIQNQLRIPFRQKYRKVQCIIDCFEISIPKSNDPILQSLTRSRYKNSNTMKYLISCTPDGLISFISKGFGGRSTNQTVVEESGFLDLLEPGSQIMADKRFKHVEEQFSLKNNTLVSTGTKNSKLVTKRVLNLRKHAKRAISRIREFTILQPDTRAQLNLIKYLDFIIQIVCGIINAQNTVVKI